MCTIYEHSITFYSNIDTYLVVPFLRSTLTGFRTFYLLTNIIAPKIISN